MSDMVRAKPRMRPSGHVELSGWTLPETEEMAGVFAPLVKKCAAEAIDVVVEEKAWTSLVSERPGNMVFVTGLQDEKGFEIEYETSLQELITYLLETHECEKGVYDGKNYFLSLSKVFREIADHLESLRFSEDD